MDEDTLGGPSELWTLPKWMPLARRSCLLLIGWVSESDDDVIKPLEAGAAGDASTRDCNGGDGTIMPYLAGMTAFCAAWEAPRLGSPYLRACRSITENC